MVLTASILAIGDELLQGHTVDTNSPWIAQILFPYGVKIIERRAIPDDKSAIKSATKDLLANRPGFLFVTGGLGPTHDDITRAAFKELFGVEEIFDADYFEQLRQRFAKRGFDIPASNRSQAMILSNSDPIPNGHGTALGMHIVEEDTQIFLMPGVPREMKGMIADWIIPHYITEGSAPLQMSLNTTGVPESKLADELQDVLSKYSDQVQFAFLPHHTGVNIRLTGRQVGNDSQVEKVVTLLRERIGKSLYGDNDDTMSSVVARILQKKKLTVAVAESCTGGMIAKQLTDIPGSSDYFLGGVVAYSNDLKTKMLQVDDQIIAQHGAVSPEVARLMAESIRSSTGAHFGIGTTGISGPGGGSPEKPVGLVYVSLATPEKTVIHKYHFLPERQRHREMTTQAALNLVRLSALE